MADGSAYLKRASTKTVVEACRQTGMVAFLCGGLNDRDIARVTSAAINELDEKNLELSAFFASSLDNDSSYQSISYEIEDRNPTYRFVTLVKRIKFIDVGFDRADRVVHGPFIDRRKAVKLLPLLNEIFGEERKA